MPIFPLPQFEADVKADQEAYEALKPPKTIVVRFGVVKMIGEFPYDGDAKPGCGSKLVARTHRGTELCEMLTSTCPNAGCSKSVSRKEMLEYIDNSGGRDYPYFVEGKILRIASVEDMNKQSALEAVKHEHVVAARQAVERLGLHMKIVDAEEIIGGERITFYFASTKEEHVRVDFRPLVMELAKQYHTRIEMRQVGARDEARITADYEKCGQHCCCKSFLKVLKPVSMKNAKIQKATLDPLKISGRCGRLMCCLRYEESTYDDLRKRLPKKKVAVMTPDGPGIVIDTQILTQLVLVRIDATNEDGAYPVENIELLTGKPGGPAAKPGAGDEADEGDGAELADGSAAGPAPRTDRAPAGQPPQPPHPAAQPPRRDPRDLNDPRDRRPTDRRDAAPRTDQPPAAPRGDRPRDDRPRDDRPRDDRPRDDRPRDDRPRNDRGGPGGRGPGGGPDGPRPSGPGGGSQGPDRRDSRGPSSGSGSGPRGGPTSRPTGERPQGERQQSDRPRSDRPAGDRPPQGDRRPPSGGQGGGGGFPPAQQQQGQRSPQVPRPPGAPGRSPDAWPQNMGGGPGRNSPQNQPQQQSRPEKTDEQAGQTPPARPFTPPPPPDSRGDAPSA